MKEIAINELKAIRNKEGLVLQGCGGDADRWIAGINEILTEEGILRNGSLFASDEISRFENDGLTCLLFDMENAELDMGRFAMWRLANRSVYGATWFSDYMQNRFGIDITAVPKDEQEQERFKPDCALIGEDGNVYNLTGLASRTLEEHGMRKEATEICERITHCKSYEEALCTLGEYANITSAYDEVEIEDDTYEMEPADGIGGMEM
jgi:hypothetical protein